MSTPHDVIVVGGSYAGQSAALMLARARRDVLVIDAGQRRNRFATAAHGFLTRDGTDPAEIAALGRAQLVAYPTVTWLDGRAATASGSAGAFTVTTADGRSHEGKRLVLASGVVDELPAIPGLADGWGQTVFACPYCHGYELGGARVAVLASHVMSSHQAMMLPDWGPTALLASPTQPLALDAEARAGLERRGVTIEPTPVASFTSDGSTIVAQLADGRHLAFAGVFVAPMVRPTSPLAAQLGCAEDVTPVGALVAADPMTRQTSIPGVFACGDSANPMASIAIAVADGARAGAGTHRSLIYG